jgi:hypothetical protein
MFFVFFSIVSAAIELKIVVLAAWRREGEDMSRKQHDGELFYYPW